MSETQVERVNRSGDIEYFYNNAEFQLSILHSLTIIQENQIANMSFCVKAVKAQKILANIVYVSAKVHEADVYNYPVKKFHCKRPFK